MKISRAIVSVSDKAGIVEFAKGLKEFGVEILSTGGTAKKLRDNGIDVIEISDYTGSPEILDGRLKTLHPIIHGGILGIRKNSKHQKEMEENSIKPIDLIVVNLYPFEETIAKSGCTFEDAIENIDIGGPTMLRAAAKNHKDVGVVVDHNDYSKILDEMKISNGELSDETKFELAKKVFALTARYDSLISNYLSAIDGVGDGLCTLPFPDTLSLQVRKVGDLRYGENPHQKAAFYKENVITEPCVAGICQLHGKELSYNNIMDADAAIEIVKEFCDERFAAILKHTNPCGGGISKKSLLEAFCKAKETDPVSAFGGVVGLSREVDTDTASAIAETFFEVVVAPDFSDEGLEILQKKKNIRLLKLDGLGKPFTGDGWNTRKVVGGLLIQDRDLEMKDVRKCEVVTRRKPSGEEYDALAFAWKICKHVKSNAIVFAGRNQLLGVGAGQMSRVDSVRIAAMKMKENFDLSRLALHASRVLASDAFFPFRDGIDAAASAGAAAIIQPGGSKRDSEAIEAADEHDIAMIFTGMRHFKH